MKNNLPSVTAKEERLAAHGIPFGASWAKLCGGDCLGCVAPGAGAAGDAHMAGEESCRRNCANCERAACYAVALGDPS